MKTKLTPWQVTVSAFLLGLSIVSGTQYAPERHAYADEPVSINCVSETVRASLRDLGVRAENHKTHFPAVFSAQDKQALTDEFKSDGRPILVVTDAHYGQKSGVITVMKVLKEQVEKLTDGKVTIHYLTPDQFHPQVKINYQDLIFSHMGQKEFDKILKDMNPQAVHVMVEGILGKSARKYLVKNNIPFTTAYHTMFPEYARDTAAKYMPNPIPELVRKVTNANLRSFHSASEGVMVPTKTMADSLVAGGYNPEQLRYWSHGVDIDLFNPSKADPKIYEGLPRPISLFVGRVAIEKNIEDFLKMKIPGTKVVGGSGPELEMLKKKYPDVVFLGRQNYDDLPKFYASSDLFVFPSLTDTFGLVQLEANAAGVPVVAYKVQGPIDVVTSPKSGVLAEYSNGAGDQNVKNLEQAWHEAQKIQRKDAREFAEAHTWEQSTLEFMWFLSRLQKDRAPASAKPPISLPALSNQSH